ncbi:hypothetical protein KKH36_01680 [Patescibacteria group bacterium]|nr:hypothetical protein [Patescibacteria group bacterium]
MVENTSKKNIKSGYVIPHYLYKDKQVKYYGDFGIKIDFSGDEKKWGNHEEVVLEPRKNFFDSNPLTIMGAVLTTGGIMVFYDSSEYKKGSVVLQVGMALFDSENPKILKERKEAPIYKYDLKTKEKVTPLTAVQDGDELVLTWKIGSSKKGEGRIPHPYLYLKNQNKRRIFAGIKKIFDINRHKNNPIIKPKVENNWESKATFNPAALNTGDKIHLIYRAIGQNDMSVLGYASSEDGFNFNERLDTPIYTNGKLNKKTLTNLKVSPISYISGGGGEGGCEDPRLTLIEDTVYLTYTAFDGWGSLRMALSSISLKDFLNKEWNWKKPINISKYGEINKNWVLFPEKIDGKFAIIHSVNPEISIEYLDDLEFKGDKKYIDSPFSTEKNKERWDSWVRGAGPPPIKTDKGWLLIYHAMDFYNDPNRYKMGAMLLDLKDPRKIIARSKEPILEPDEHYENNGWKAGVSYCCGAVEKDGQLLIYYGGADTVSCVAETNLNEFVNKLIETENPKIKVYTKYKKEL